MTYYRLMGEQRGFLARGSMLIDENLEYDEAVELLQDVKSEMPLWKFWLIEQEFIDEKVQSGIRSEPEPSV
jgi:hypothetical protein